MNSEADLAETVWAWAVEIPASSRVVVASRRALADIVHRELLRGGQQLHDGNAHGVRRGLENERHLFIFSISRPKLTGSVRGRRFHGRKQIYDILFI